ncbi:MAG: hypothetical protein OQK67_02885 [Chlorobium sp.]|nr:hypothetical protein [Chlorobium sp.]
MRRMQIVLFMVCIAIPIVFWSNESEAIPVFARKYGTSCSTCHIGYPARNAFGEAFRNNGYRWPGGQDEDKVKVRQTPLGSDSWKGVWPQAIFPADLPGIFPAAVFMKSTLLEYRAEDKKYRWGLDGDIEILFAATIGDNISIIGDWAVNSGDAPAFQLLYALDEGVILGFGDVGITKLFTIISASSNGNGNSYAVKLPSPGKALELRIAGGEKKGGYSLIAGVGRGEAEWSEEPFDSRYVRATYKICGTGLLSGTGCGLGNDMIGMDNAVTIGANYFNSHEGVEGTKNAYGGDITATYGSVRAIAQIGRLIEADVTQYSAELDYFFYPWLVGVVRFEDWDVPGDERTYTSAIIPGFAAFIRANAKLGSEFVIGNGQDDNTLKVFAQLAF